MKKFKTMLVTLFVTLLLTGVVEARYYRGPIVIDFGWPMVIHLILPAVCYDIIGGRIHRVPCTNTLL